jgi:hypothetical protein
MVGQLAKWKLRTVTCRRSSKSRAAIFFISETFAENRLIPSLPKEGTSLKLGAEASQVTVSCDLQYGLLTGGPAR